MKKDGWKLVADSNMPLLDETFARHGALTLVDGRDLAAAQVKNSDVLLVRSVTRVGPDLLAGSKVRFVGTATIGTDHLDIPWLESNGIAWAGAPGCNADAAAQYTLSMMMLACRRLDRNFFEQKVGIVGHGNVGSRLAKLLRALQIETIACDPPLSDSGEPGLVGLEETLACDIVSLHVPLTRTGSHATFHMIGAAQLASMRSPSLLVNTARGDVIDQNALLDELRRARLNAALDVWHGEPRPDPELVNLATVASPHVAGYSIEGRNNGTLALYRRFLEWSGAGSGTGGSVNAEAQGLARLRDLEPGALQRSVSEAVIQATGIARDDHALREAVSGTLGVPGFDDLRRNYPLRREFAGWSASLPPGTLSRKLDDLGFSVTSRPPAG